ncbi:MAG: polyprenyl synthetase family protein [Thermoproteota archaeon]
MAKENIIQERIDYKPVEDALRYFIEESCDSSTLFPALLSLSCEAVGGDHEDTIPTAAALIFVTGAVDIHDDIIDQSKFKGPKLTVFGKFGGDIALLVGDALLLKGLKLLNEVNEHLPRKHRKKIIDLAKNSLFEIGFAEAKETSLRGRWDLSPEEYLEIIREKAAITRAIAQIGAILGKGSEEEVRALGKYGRILGILSTIRDDYIDIFEPEEVKNRAENEVLPLPILYAFQNRMAKKKILGIIGKERIEEGDTRRILEIISETEGSEIFKEKLKYFYDRGEKALKNIKNTRISASLREVLRDITEGL